MKNKLLSYIGVADGGNGGNGGDVYFRSTGRLSSLYDLRRAHFYGNNGKCGMVSFGIIDMYKLNINFVGSEERWANWQRHVLFSSLRNRNLRDKKE